MAKTRYTFKSGAPGAEPGLYKSCLNSERDISIRWWDGALWWDISSSRGSTFTSYVPGACDWKDSLVKRPE